MLSQRVHSDFLCYVLELYSEKEGKRSLLPTCEGLHLVPGPGRALHPAPPRGLGPVSVPRACLVVQGLVQAQLGHLAQGTCAKQPTRSASFIFWLTPSSESQRCGLGIGVVGFLFLASWLL